VVLKDVAIWKLGNVSAINSFRFPLLFPCEIVMFIIFYGGKQNEERYGMHFSPMFFTSFVILHFAVENRRKGIENTQRQH